MGRKFVAGWHVRDAMPEALVATALLRPLLGQRSAADLVVHSDRGGQYRNKPYRALLHQRQALRSHSRRGRTR